MFYLKEKLAHVSTECIDSIRGYTNVVVVCRHSIVQNAHALLDVIGRSFRSSAHPLRRCLYLAIGYRYLLIHLSIPVYVGTTLVYISLKSITK